MNERLWYGQLWGPSQRVVTLFNPFLVFGDLVSGEITGAANGLLDAAVGENVHELRQSSREANDGESRQGGAPGRERGAQLEGKIIFLTTLHCFAHRLQEYLFL